MSYTPIQELQVGQITQVFLIKKVNIGKTGAGKPYTGFILKDRHAEIKCVIWGETLSQYKDGMFVQITGEVAPYQDSLQIKANRQSIMPVPIPSNIEDYLYSLDGVTTQRLWEELISEIELIQDNFLKAVVSNVIKQERDGFSLKNCPLTDESYGNYCGALLEHIIYSLRHCKSVQSNYFDRNTPIDFDLLRSIVILHDVGRVEGFTNIFSVEKTTRAKLEGISNLSYRMISDALYQMKIDGETCDETKVSKLLHGVLVSSNTKLTPLFIEALIAQQVQKLDALVGIYSRSINGAKSDQEFTWTNKIIGSELFNG